MIEIDWKNDYCHDFVCYKCQQAKLNLNGFQRGKRQFHCPQCRCQIPSSVSLNRRSLYLESRLVDEEIDWSKDYNGEFVCPKCSKLGMIARGINRCTNKRQFYCLSCKKVQQEFSYIQNLWGEDWDYLFCHYHGWSKTSLSKIELKPVKKVIPVHSNNPLLACIRTLIKDLDIRDENGQPAKFKAKILRTTRLTQLFEQGHDLAVVSAWAGHKRFATTSTYYTKVSCDLIEQEAGHIQKALVNSEGHRVLYESFPKSFWETPQAHKLELSGTHINTPIYGYCGLDLDQDCHKFRACYTCGNFVATPEKLPQYIKTCDELRGKQSKALANGQDVLVEQFGSQADQLDKIIASLQEAA